MHRTFCVYAVLPTYQPSKTPTAELRKCVDLARTCYSAGCTLEQVRGCVRHLIVCGPALYAYLGCSTAVTGD